MHRSNEKNLRNSHERKIQADTHFYFSKSNKVYPITYKKHITDFDIKEPPTDMDNYEIVKAKLLYLVYYLPKNNNLYNQQQQKALIAQVEHLINIIENDVALPSKLWFSDSPTERQNKIAANKIVLRDVYDVISQPENNLQSYQDKLAARKKDARSDKIIGILSAIGGIVMTAVGTFLMIAQPWFTLLFVAGIFAFTDGVRRIPEGIKQLENIGEISAKTLKM